MGTAAVKHHLPQYDPLCEQVHCIECYPMSISIHVFWVGMDSSVQQTHSFGSGDGLSISSQQKGFQSSHWHQWMEDPNGHQLSVRFQHSNIT